MEVLGVAQAGNVHLGLVRWLGPQLLGTRQAFAHTCGWLLSCGRGLQVASWRNAVPPTLASPWISVEELERLAEEAGGWVCRWLRGAGV